MLIMKKTIFQTILLAVSLGFTGIAFGLTAPEALTLDPLWDNGTIVTHTGAGAGGAHVSLLQNETKKLPNFGYEATGPVSP